MSFPFRIRVAAGVLLAGTGTVAAQGLEPLKKGYEEEVARTVLPLREGYRKALMALEQSLAGKGDYAGAKRVQEERRAIEKAISRPDAAATGASSTAADGRVRLGSGGAEPGGGIRLESGAWTGWETAGATIRWPLPPGLPGGGYSVELVYRSTGAGELPLTVRENFHGLTRTVRLEASAEEERTVRLSVLRVRSGAAWLEIKTSGPGTAAGFRLLEVALLPEGGGS